MKSLYLAAVLAGAATLACSSDRTVGLTPDSPLLNKSGNSVPFKATQSALAVLPVGVDCPTGSLPSATSVAGIGTHLGSFTGAGTACTAFTRQVTFVFLTSTNNVVAANGDELWFTLDPVALGQGAVIVGPSGPTRLTWTGVYNVTGGTGRFANATGEVKVVGSRDLTVPNAPFVSEIEGRISSVGSKK